MAKYTIELRRLCEIFSRQTVENWFKSYNLSDYLTENQINTIQNSKMWTKDKLAKKIVDHYFMREIGLETPALFEHYAKITMEEIMEEKLPLIYTNSLEYDPLVNVDFTEEFNRNIDNSGSANSNGTSNSSSNSNSDSLSINNTTPQSKITKQNLESGLYASSVNQSENSSNITDNTNTNNTSNSSSNTIESYTRKQKGNSGVLSTNQKLIEQFRNNIVAIDKQIINELDILFMGLF